MKKTKLFFLLGLSFLLTTCKKDIIVPDAEFEKLFGDWEWVQSSGGFTGGILTPETSGYTLTRKFKSNGVVIFYKNGKRAERMTYEFGEGTSIFTNQPAWMIEYKNGNSKVGIISHSFKFGGQDSLYLFDECTDCYSHIYLRK